MAGLVDRIANQDTSNSDFSSMRKPCRPWWLFWSPAWMRTERSMSGKALVKFWPIRSLKTSDVWKTGKSWSRLSFSWSTGRSTFRWIKKFFLSFGLRPPLRPNSQYFPFPFVCACRQRSGVGQPGRHNYWIFRSEISAFYWASSVRTVFTRLAESRPAFEYSS